MRTIGIIAEYNPFHNGHLYQYEQLRSLYPDARILVVMSGDFVQRGQPALLDKYTRARMALLSGADLVLELPAAFSTGSAEIFARGGIGLLCALGITDAISFGAEAGPSPLFQTLADLFESEPAAYKESLRAALKSGLSFPAAREKAASCVLSDTVSPEELHAFLSSPNNILGIEYLRVIRRNHSSMKILPVRRMGMAYHEEELAEDRLPSASAIRRSLMEGKFPQNALPPQASSLLKQQAEASALLGTEDLDEFLRYKLLMLDPAALPPVYDLSPALFDRILKQRYAYTSFESFADQLKTRELTRSRICRALLHLLLDMQEDPGQPSYIRLLGFSRSASDLIPQIRKKASLPLITRPAREAAALNPKARKSLEENTRASCLYEALKCRRTGDPFVHEYRKNLIIL